MKIIDKSGEPRDDESIREAIDVIGTVLLNPLKYPPKLVLLAPTIRDALRELLVLRVFRKEKERR